MEGIVEPQERILAAGREILATSGMRAITTHAIAQRAHVSKKTLYQCFPSKDALLEAIVLSLLEQHLSRWDTILDGDAPAIDRIQASLRLVTEFLPELQVHVLSQVESVAPHLWKSIDAVRMKRIRKLRLLMEDAQREGFFRSDVNPEHWVLLLMGAIRSVVNPTVLLREGISFVDMFRSVHLIYYHGLLTDEGRRYSTEKENV
jgi:AcrR family transcriptional regulator